MQHLAKLWMIPAAIVASVAVCASASAQDFANPAVNITNEAMVASGACIARSISELDDGSKAAPYVAKLVAARCAKQISRSVGLATLMVGKPDEYAKNLRYTNEELTANAVVRARASGKRHV